MNTTDNRTYLALGDSMSIDDYTGVKDGGAVNQFFRTLGDSWILDDRTFDGCQMAGVPRDGIGDLITLTIGGNDLLWNRERYLCEGLADFAAEHKALLKTIRQTNPDAIFVVGDIYAPDAPLSDAEESALTEANAAIHSNCHDVGALQAGIYEAFNGHEQTFLCLAIEPTLEGAKAIAELFRIATADRINLD